MEINTVFLYAELFKLYQAKRPIHDIAKIFHNSLARVLTDCLSALRQDFPATELILSGGVFNNKILLTNLYTQINALPADQENLKNQNLQILFPKILPWTTPA